MNLKPFVAFALLLALNVTTSFSARAQESKAYQTIANSKLSETQIKNLFAFARVYGLVKYFYPLQKKDRINWSYVAAQGSQQVLDATSEEDLKEAMVAVFGPIAPLLQIHSTSDSLSPKRLESSNRYYYNLHKGLGQDKADLPILTRKMFILKQPASHALSPTAISWLRQRLS